MEHASTVRFRHGRLVPQRPRGVSSPEERREAVLVLLDGAKDGLTRREIHARLAPGVSERQVRRALEDLKSRGLVVSPGRGRSGRWKRLGRSTD